MAKFLFESTIKVKNELKAVFTWLSFFWQSSLFCRSCSDNCRCWNYN